MNFKEVYKLKRVTSVINGKTIRLSHFCKS